MASKNKGLSNKKRNRGHAKNEKYCLIKLPQLCGNCFKYTRCPHINKVKVLMGGM